MAIEKYNYTLKCVTSQLHSVAGDSLCSFENGILCFYRIYIYYKILYLDQFHPIKF